MAVVKLSWDQYFMEIAQKVAERSTCDRANVGCVLVIDRQIVSTGYNGSARGASHCDDVGHMMSGGHCVRTVHAEVNAIAQAAKHGTKIDGATAYITHFPCFECAKVLVNSGIVRVVYSDGYRMSTETMELFSVCGISWEKI